MTQPGDGPDGFTPRAYEAEVYAKVAAAEANKIPYWDPDWRDPAKVAGDYSNAVAEAYETKMAAEGGGYRDGLNTSDMDYRGVPHEKLISMVKDDVSPEDVDEQGMIVNDLGNAFKELATTFRQAASKEQAGWQGEGAQSAFGYLGGYATWADASGDKAFLSANRYSQTSAALVNARNGMPEPAGRTVTQSLDMVHQQLSSGNIGAALDTFKNMQPQAAAQAQAQQQAAEVVAQRDQMLYSGGSTQPTYVAPPQLSAFTAPAPSVGGATGGGHSAAIPDVGHTTAAGAFTPSAPVSAPGPTGGPGFVPSPGSPVSGGISTGSSPVSGYAPPGGGDMRGWSRSPASALGPGLDAGLVSTVGGTGTGGDISRGGSGRSGSGSGGPGGSSGRAGGRVPPGGSANEEPGAGKRSGTAEPGAKAAAEAARTGSAGKAGQVGKAGASGMPGAAGGKKGEKGEDDKEHKRAAYLLEHDPDAAFDLNVETDKHGNKIAPPVIGE